MLLDLKSLNIQYDMKIKGVLHIGGYIGEECQLYHYMGIENAIFFEPIKAHYEALSNRIQVFNYPYKLMPVALGNKQCEIEINVSKTDNGDGSGASSSFLEPKVHLSQYPNITFEEKELVHMRMLDDLAFTANVIDIQKFNMINIDVQGYELEVFKGAKRCLEHIDYIIAEVNRDDVYKDCVQIEELDNFLSGHGFERLETSWEGQTWGDAFYKRNDV